MVDQGEVVAQIAALVVRVIRRLQAHLKALMVVLVVLERLIMDVVVVAVREALDR